MKTFPLQILGILIIALQGGLVSAYSVFDVAPGHEAVPNQFPWYVVIKDDEKAFCGGSVLTDSWVVTAAQCCVDHTSLHLTFGSVKIDDVDDDAVTMTATELHVHPENGKANKPFARPINDICLIKLPETLKLSASIAPLKLVRSAVASNTFVDNTVSTAGFGHSEDRKLLWGQMHVVDNSECDNYFELRVETPKFCVEGYDKIPYQLFCRGAPGSALIVKDEHDGEWMQIGISSQLIHDRCSPEGNGAFVSITPLLDFIYTTTDLARN